MAGAVDGNGVYIYAETDSASPFSTLLNLGMNAISTKIGSLVSQINAITTARDAAWTPYSPTPTPSSGAFTTATASGRYKQIGKTVTVTMTITLTSTGTGGGAVIVPLPIQMAGIATFGMGRDASTGESLRIAINSATNAAIVRADNSSAIVSGHVLQATLTYEAA